jgi:hypothetical protein
VEEFHLLWAERFARFDGDHGRGRPPREYWSWEIGHILPAISPQNVGTLRASDLLNASILFDAKYRSGGGDE